MGGLVVKLVPVIEAECGNNPENHGYFREVALDLVNQTETLGNVVNLSMHINNLTPHQHLSPAINCAELTKLKTDSLVDQMKQFFNPSNFLEGSDLNMAVRDVAQCLNNLLNGIKFYDNENYQRCIQFSQIIANPHEYARFANVEDAKQEALTHICNIISAIPKIAESPEMALETVSRNALEAAECLAHISAVEPHQHPYCVAFINAITGLIVNSLNGIQYEDLDLNDIINTTSNLLFNLGLEQHGEFKQKLYDACRKVLEECARLGQLCEASNDHVAEGRSAAEQAMYLSRLVRILAPIAEHKDISPMVEKPIADLKATVAVCHESVSETIDNQTTNVEIAIEEFEKAISQFKQSTGAVMNEAVQVIDEMFTDMAMKAAEVDNELKQEQDEDFDYEAFGFSKDILAEVMQVSNYAKQLVIASAALQREKMAKEAWMRQNYPEQWAEEHPDKVYSQQSDFDHGLVSAALAVVKAIGELCKACTDMVDHDITPEYLIVRSQYVAECCTQLVVASKVQNIDKKGINPNLEKLIAASDGIKKITDNIVKKTEEAGHFKESDATQMKWKETGNAWRDELNLQDYVNRVQRKIQKLHGQVRDLYKQNYAQNNLKASRTRAEITDETINEAVNSVDNKFKEGLAQRTTQILKLKEEIRQQDIILKKAEAKLLYIKENRVKPGDESTEEE